MKIMRKWLALMLTIPMVLGDFSGITALAAEMGNVDETPAWAENEESSETDNDENNVVSGIDVTDSKTDNTDSKTGVMDSETDNTVQETGNTVSETDNTVSDTSNTASETDNIVPDADNTVSEFDTETQLPALHIGQIKEREELPHTEDSKFIYDLPISFGTSDYVTLFVNYGIDGILEKEEQGGIVWSILRAKKGTEEGSVNLIGEEDDWIGFETVSDSPYFIMTDDEDKSENNNENKDVNKDTNGSQYKTVRLDIINDKTEEDTTISADADAETETDTAISDAADSEIYNYYIRAAYYIGGALDANEALDTDDILQADGEFYAAVTLPFLPNDDGDADGALDEQEFGEATAGEDIKDDASAAGDAAKGEANGDESGLEDSDIDNLSDDAEADAGTGEGSGDAGSSDGSESDGTDQDADKKVSGLKLDKKKITMHVGDFSQVDATIEPEGVSAEITWKSSNESVATVEAVTAAGNQGSESSGNGMRSAMITAKGVGSAQVTAECNGITAVIKVNVVEELYDNSEDNGMRIDGFQRESDDFVYTGDKITQNIQVYHNSTLLREKTDYTVTYKNNINAAAYNSAKAPSLTIKLKGQYSGSVTLYYTIKPLNISDVDIYKTNAGNTNNGDAAGDNADSNNSSGYEQAVTYGKTLKIPTPELTFGKKKLALNKDFTCDYSTLPKDYKKGDSYEAGKEYNYTVNGIGNFTGSFQMRLVVIKDKNLNFNTAAVTLNKKQYEYNGTALAKSDVAIEKVKVGKAVLAKTDYDYEVCADAVDGAYVMVYPTEAGRSKGYRGSKRVNLKLIGDRNIKEAVSGSAWKDSITFSQKTVDENGGIFQEEENILAFGGETLIEGKDYTIKYANAGKAGKASATFTGKGRYKGTLKKTYTIQPNTDKDGITVAWKNVTLQPLEIAYQKGGAVPEFDLKDSDGRVLKVKTDYTVKVKNNKTPGTDMDLEINGKGNYKGYKAAYKIKVVNGDINKCTILVPDMPESTKPDGWKSTKITIKDVNGKKLSAGTDYSKEIGYVVDGGKATPSVGDTVSVTVNGAGAYAGTTITGNYKIYDKNKGINKWVIKIDDQTYTGEAIELSTLGDIHVYATSADAKKGINELYNAVEIVEYTNNIKAGTAKVTLRASRYDEYGGMRTCSFKIKKKSYGINHVKGITLDKITLPMSIRDNNEARRTLTATLTPENSDEEIWNSTVVWSVSNSSVATVETRIIDKTTVAGVIIPKKEGSVTITATAQDGNKKAQCKVTIVDAPILKDAGKTIEGKAGDTHPLEFEDEVNLSDVVFESSNTEMVSIDKNGLLKMEKVGAALIKVYTNKRKYVQECYVIVKGDEEEQLPEGKRKIYEQEAGTTDDTPAINKILRYWENHPASYDYVYIPAGVYKIDAVSSFGGIVLTSNQTLIMSPSALIMAIGNNKTSYHVIYAFGRKNITISGGQIIGERDEHQGKGGEWGHGIDIQGCTDVHISNMDISKCWGDGICLGEYDDNSSGKTKHVPSDTITIENCNLHNNRRNNLSITDANNVTIDNCQFNYAKGTDPQYGICIEYNYNGPTKNVKIYNSTFKGNAKASMGIIKAATDIRLENCTLDGNFYNKAGKNVILKNTTIKGEIVDDPKGIKRE